MKKLLIIMGSFAAVLIIVALVLFGIQGKNRNEKLENLQKEIVEQRANEQAEKAAERLADSIQREKEKKALEDIAKAFKGTPRPDPKLCMRISWTASEKEWEAMPMSKQEILDLAKTSSYGSPVYIKGEVTEIVGTLVIHDIYSPAPTQTVVWLKYKVNEEDEIRRTILLKGEYPCDQIQYLPGGLNWQTWCCTTCIKYGGDFREIPQKKGTLKDPCKKGSSKCQECNGNIDAGDEQGDGFREEKNGSRPKNDTIQDPKEIWVGWGNL